MKRGAAGLIVDSPLDTGNRPGYWILDSVEKAFIEPQEYRVHGGGELRDKSGFR